MALEWFFIKPLNYRELVTDVEAVTIDELIEFFSPDPIEEDDIEYQEAA